MTYLVHGQIVLADGILEGHALQCSGERITGILAEDAVPADADCVDLEGGFLLPGFIDVQINGAGGRQFNDAPTEETLRIMSAALTPTGATAFMPTLISAEYDTIASAIAATDNAIAEGVPGLTGLHVEGPFISPARHGIHDQRLFRKLDDAGMALLTSLKHGKLIVTLAAEQATPEQITALTHAGVIVSLGHSDADYDTAMAGLDAGARGFTHLYNAMSPLMTRAPNMVGAALTSPEAWCGIVMDGHHVHPAALKVAWACKGAEKLMLVTDAHANAGTDLTHFIMQGRPITVKNGVCLGADGTIAGSCLTMASAFRNAQRFLGIDMVTAMRLASSNPAAFLGQTSERGFIATGLRADLVLMDAQQNVRKVWIGGKPVKTGK